ncbi:MAG: amidohydrolase family protein [Bryobacterales bacterium]|nr:amidohydrolase family protein [Bryobacterales bacterium]
MFTLDFASTQSAVRSATDSKILIRGARQVVTLQGPARMRVGDELGRPAAIRDASILIENGRIAQIGSARRLENLRDSSSIRWVDARRLVVLPGFVDVVADLASAGPAERSVTAAGDDPVGASSLLNRRATVELHRLALAGSTFVRASFAFPRDGTERGRLLRHLLRVELPASAFQAALRVDPGRLLEESPHTMALRDLVTPQSRQHLRELSPLLAAEFDGDMLRALQPAKRFRLLRAIARELPCQVTGAEVWTAAELLDLGLAANCLVEGSLPADSQKLLRLAQWNFPWLLCAGAATLRADGSLERLPRALREGLRLALATGYRCGQPGVLNPLAMLALLRHQTGLDAAPLLQLQIANTAFALGVGHRMGTLEAGKEANLVLVDCDDYRDIGMYVGAPRIVAVFRRGKLLGDSSADQSDLPAGR